MCRPAAGRSENLAEELPGARVPRLVEEGRGRTMLEENRATAATTMKAIITAGRKANADFGCYRDAFLE